MAFISTQFNMVRSESNGLSEDFFQQVESDNSKMLMTYDELQKNIGTHEG